MRSPHNRLEPPFQREDGAEFTAFLQATEEGAQASYRVTLNVGNETHVQPGGPRLFATAAESVSWLDQMAMAHGFTNYPMVRE